MNMRGRLKNSRRRETLRDLARKDAAAIEAMLVQRLADGSVAKDKPVVVCVKSPYAARETLRHMKAESKRLVQFEVPVGS